METVDLDGLRIAFHRVGDGPPLVLLHGYVGDGLSTWRRQLEGLSDEFTVVAWDAPGAGRSSDPPELEWPATPAGAPVCFDALACRLTTGSWRDRRGPPRRPGRRPGGGPYPRARRSPAGVNPVISWSADRFG